MYGSNSQSGLESENDGNFKDLDQRKGSRTQSLHQNQNLQKQAHLLISENDKKNKFNPNVKKTSSYTLKDQSFLNQINMKMSPDQMISGRKNSFDD